MINNLLINELNIIENEIQESINNLENYFITEARGILLFNKGRLSTTLKILDSMNDSNNPIYFNQAVKVINKVMELEELIK